MPSHILSELTAHNQPDQPRNEIDAPLKKPFAAIGEQPEDFEFKRAIHLRRKRLLLNLEEKE